MQISLEEAIEIHGKALTRRLKRGAVRAACESAERRRSAGDAEGERVWLRVAERARRLLNDEAPEADRALRH